MKALGAPWVSTLIQALTVGVLAWALFWATRQAGAARDAVRALVDQSLTDRMVQQVRFLAENPKLGLAVFSTFSHLSEEKVQAFMCAHVFLLHFESVLAQRPQLPKGQDPLYLESMKQIFSQAPVLHEWMRRTGHVWSDELSEIASQSLRGRERPEA